MVESARIIPKNIQNSKSETDLIKFSIVSSIILSMQGEKDTHQNIMVV